MLNKRFMGHAIIGLSTLILCYFFGSKGTSLLALLAFNAIIFKKKLDERELQVFYKTGNYTIFALLISYFITRETSILNMIKIDTFQFVILFSLTSHGIIGLYFNNKE